MERNFSPEDLRSTFIGRFKDFKQEYFFIFNPGRGLGRRLLYDLKLAELIEGKRKELAKIVGIEASEEIYNQVIEEASSQAYIPNGEYIHHALSRLVLERTTGGVKYINPLLL